jgi:sRNA-binding regulator protein Hfq
MSLESPVPGAKKRSITPTARTVSRSGPVSNFRLPPFSLSQNQEQDAAQRQAELFYLQKQIQAQTPMVLVLEDGELVEGCIEWYDRNVLKVRGRTKTLVYKAAIKYMYKQGDAGQ